MRTTRRTALRGAATLAAYTAAATVPTIAPAFPGVDPTLVAAAKLETAIAEFVAVGRTCRTVADEHTPEFEAASHRLCEANEAFSEAPITTPTGALAKLKELAEAFQSYGYDGHFETLAAFLESLAGRATS